MSFNPTQPPPELLPNGLVNPARRKWELDQAEDKAMRDRVRARFGDHPRTPAQWKNDLARLHRDEIAELVAEIRSKKQSRRSDRSRLPGRRELWRPVSPEGVAINDRLGQAVAGLAIIDRESSRRHHARTDALRDILAEIQDLAEMMETAR